MKLPPKPERKEKESDVQKRIVAVAARFRGVRLARNNVGTITDARGIPVTFGLGEGSPDLVGIITCETDGFRFAVAIGIEVKQPGRYATKDQKAWHEAARRRGMRTGVCRSPEDAVMFLESEIGRLEMAGFRIVDVDAELAA